MRLLEELGSGLIFIGSVAKTAKKHPIPWHEVFDQIWRITVQSLATTALAGFFVGAIMAVQFSLQIRDFGALGFLGGLATSATVREIGPLLIAFMLSGKVGAFTSAELGTMRVTEQIDAIRCLGANPLLEIILPRFIGIIVSSFFLLGAGLMMSLAGGVLMGYGFAGISAAEYIRHIPTVVNGFSIFSGLVKCAVFALILASICTYKGYTASGGSKGVGRAVVDTAVSTMVGIVIADWVTSQLGNVILKIYLSS